MNIRLITTRDDIDSLKPNEKTVYFSFRPSSIDLINLILKSPELQMIQVPASHVGELPDAIDIFLEMLDINVLEWDEWGHIRDIECFSVSDMSVSTS